MGVEEVVLPVIHMLVQAEEEVDMIHQVIAELPIPVEVEAVKLRRVVVV